MIDGNLDYHHDTYEAPERGTPVGTSLRDAIAEHTSSGSGRIDHIAKEARDEHQGKIRERKDRLPDQHTLEAHNKRSLRDTLKQSFEQAERKPAITTVSRTSLEVPSNIPASTVMSTWSKEAQLGYERADPALKTELARTMKNAQRAMETHGAVEKVMAPIRNVFAQHGIKSDAEAIGHLVQWEGALRHPDENVRAHSAAQIMHANRIDPHRVAAMMGVQVQQHYDPHFSQSSPEEMAAVNREIGQFSQGRQHFETVRHAMGLLIHAKAESYIKPDGSINLDKVYKEACRNLGIGAGTSERRQSVSPRSNPPAFVDKGKRSGSVRDSILGAFATQSGR